MRQPNADPSRAKPPSGDPGAAQYSLRAAERVCDILDLFAARGGSLSFGSLVTETGMPKGTMVRYLSVLEARNYVDRDADTLEYRLGTAALGLRSEATERLLEVAHPYLEALRDASGETVNLGLLSGRRISYVAIVESQRGVRLAAKPGDRDYIHCTALGKAVAAQMPEAWVRETVQAEGLPPRTDRTITTLELLLQELEQVRRQGWAMDDRENENDGRCIGVSIPSGPIPAAVSVSAPSSRLPLTGVPELTSRIRDTVAKIAAGLT